MEDHQYCRRPPVDGVVPDIEEWERELDGWPLISDPFLGTISAPPSPDRPRSVAFVGPKGDVNGEYATTSAATTPTFFNDPNHNGTVTPQPMDYYAPPGVNDWMEATLQLPVATGYDIPVTTAAASSVVYAAPQPLVAPIDDNEAFFAALGRAEFGQLNLQDNVDTSPPPPILFAEPADAEAALAEDGGSCTTDDWTSSGSPMSEEEIFEEIQRECAEIERKSASPASSTAGSPQPSTSTATRTSHRSRRTMPYPKRPVSRRSTHSPLDDRKRELNRIAATKYREKKRAEKEQRSQELTDLETRNADLKGEMSSLEAEIRYLKNLIKDIEARKRR